MSTSLGTAYLSIEPDFDAFDRRVSTAMPGLTRRFQTLDTSQTRAARTSSRLSSVTSGLGGSLARAAGAAAGAAAAYISIAQAKEAVTTTEDLAKTTMGLHRNLGIANKEASRWGAVAKARDIDTKSLTMSFTTLSRQLTEASRGSDTAEQAFADIGVTQRELKATNGDFTKQLLTVADGFGEAEGGALRQQAAQKLLGRGYQTLLPLFAEGSKGLREQLGWADKYGATLTGKTIGPINDLIMAQRESKAAWLGIQVSFAQAVVPMLTKANDKFQSLARIMGNDKLTNAEKFEKAGQKIERWADQARDAFIAILPKLAEKAGETGPKVAKALAEGFINSNALGKLFLTGTFIRMVGGPGALGRIGAAMGGRIAAGAAGGAAASKWARMGTLAGRMVGPAMGLSIVAMLATDPAVQKAIKDMIAGEPLGAPNRETFAVKANEMFGGAQGYESFLGKEKVKIETLLGSLIFNAKTEKLVKAQNNKLAKLVGSDMATVFQKYSKMTDGVSGQITKDFKKADGAVKGHAKQTKDSLGDAGNAWGGYEREADKDTDKIGKSLDRGNDKVKKSGDVWTDVWGGMSKRSGKLARNVTANNANMANTVGEGLGVLRDNVLAATKEFGVKSKITYSIKKADKAVSTVTNLLGAQKGAVVPGVGAGDTVPLHIGGQLAAMVEPGEQVSVLNRKATAAMMELNGKIPRFASGGVIQQALGPINAPPIVADDDHGALGYNSHLHLDFFTKAQALAYGHKMQGMGWRISEYTGSNPYGFTGVTTHHDSPAHYDGTGFDANTDADETDAEVRAVARLLGGGKVATAMADKIARVLLKGPDGPLKDMGQSALDKVRDAANKFVASKMPTDPAMGVGSGAPGPNIKSLPASLQKYNHQWPYDSTDTIPASAVQALTRWQGLPSWFWKIAIGESSFQPGAVGHDPGGTTGYGLFQETTPFANPYLKAVTGGLNFNDWLNPVINTMSSKKHFDAAPSQTPNTVGFPWYGTTGLQRGGIIQKLAKGGKAGDKKDLHGSISGGKIDPAWKRYMQAQRISQRLAEMLGDKGKIARIDERIDLAQTLANLDSSELGSDLGPGERKKQIRLNEQLLAKLVMARKLARSGIDLTRVPKGMSVDPDTERRLKALRGTLGESLTGLVGVTGKGGRIFDTKIELDTLKHTSTGSSSSSAMDISGLRSVIEAAQFGVFANLPKFHEGGVVPGSPTREVPIMARGGEVVSPGGNNYYAQIDLGNGVREVVRLEFTKRNRETHLAGRQYRP